MTDFGFPRKNMVEFTQNFSANFFCIFYLMDLKRGFDLRWYGSCEALVHA
jgi:hypothetical protein